MDHGVQTRLARPGGNFENLRRVAHGSEADLAQQAHPRRAHLGVVGLGHPALRHRRAGQHLGAERAERRKAALRGNGQRLHAHRVPGAAGQVNLAGADQRGRAAMHHRLDPAELVLPRRPVAERRVDVVVDQPRHRRAAVRLDHPRAGHGKAAARGDDAIPLDQDGVGVEEGPGEVAREDQAQVADDGLGHGPELRAA